MRVAPPTVAGQAEAGRILFLGRIEPAKGVDELLQACARLAGHHPRLRLVLGGVGDLDWAQRRALELGIADRVATPGWLDAVERHYATGVVCGRLAALYTQLLGERAQQYRRPTEKDS